MEGDPQEDTPMQDQAQDDHHEGAGEGGEHYEEHGDDAMNPARECQEDRPGEEEEEGHDQKGAEGGSEHDNGTDGPMKTESDVKEEEEGKDAVKDEGSKMDIDEEKWDGKEEPVAADTKEEAEAEAEAEPVETEDADKEHEVDAPEDSRERLSSTVQVGLPGDSTMNAMTTCDGKVLLPLTDVGFQYLAAGARANVGMKSGRYLFEVRIVNAKQGSGRGARPTCSIGFSTKTGSLSLGTGGENCGFESGGYFVSSGQWSARLAKPFSPYTSVYGILLNLEEGSPNYRTVSLFENGQRCCRPQPLPESMHSKALFPAVTFCNMSLQVNFGPSCWASMPFACRMLQDASVDDVEVTAEADKQKKPEVIFPVGLPDQGTFAWLDGFLKENPTFTELSHRAIISWGMRSGLQRPRVTTACNDSPSMGFGIHEIDNYQLSNHLKWSLAPMLPRNYIVMQVKNNLLESERQKALQAFSNGAFKKVAVVVMGEPPDTFKARAQTTALAGKRRKAGEAARREEEERRKVAVSKTDREAADGEQPPEEDIEEIVRKVTESITLTEEELRANWFPKMPGEDLTQREIGRFFGKFSLPTEAEGFDEIRYVWQQEPEAKEYLQTWIADKKLTQRVEDIEPKPDFFKSYEEWKAKVSAWKRRQQDFKDGKAAAKKKKADGESEVTGLEADKMERDPDDIDPWHHQDIEDLGNGEPLYARFEWEDWAMLNLRYELHHLVHSFKKDMPDLAIHHSHLDYYYRRYFGKPLQPKMFGVSSNLELAKFLKDTIEVAHRAEVLEAQLSEDTPLENFVRLTEDQRRERKLLFDSGDETAVLKLDQSLQYEQQDWRRDRDRSRTEAGSRRAEGRSEYRGPSSAGGHGGYGERRHNSSDRPSRSRHDSHGDNGHYGNRNGHNNGSSGYGQSRPSGYNSYATGGDRGDYGRYGSNGGPPSRNSTGNRGSFPPPQYGGGGGGCYGKGPPPGYGDARRYGGGKDSGKDGGHRGSYGSWDGKGGRDRERDRSRGRSGGRGGDRGSGPGQSSYRSGEKRYASGPPQGGKGGKQPRTSYGSGGGGGGGYGRR